MEFAFSEEQQELAATVRSLLSKRADSAAPATAAIFSSRLRSAGPASPTYSGKATPRALIRWIQRPSPAGSKHTLLTM